MIMETRVKISHLTQKHKTLLSNFWRQSFAPNIFGRESVANHNVALFLFDYEILFNKWQNIIQHWTSCLPVINRAIKSFFTRPSISRIFRTTKSIFKPYYEFFITACNLKKTMPLKTVAIFALFNMAYVQATFSINEPSKISNLPDFMIGIEFNYFSHELPFVYNSIALNENKIYAERLSERALNRGCDSLNSNGNMEREIRRGFSA